MTRSPLLLLLSSLLLTVLATSGCDRKPCAKDCAATGRCTVSATAKYGCVAGSDAECHLSKGCLYYGKCTMRDGGCARTSAADCRRSNKCLWAGQCGFNDGKCTALTAADCQRSTFCKDKGMCQLKRRYGGLASCRKPGK